MKASFTLVLSLSFTLSFSQWTRVQQLAPLNILTVYHKGGTLYAGGKNIIYYSANGGQNWDSTSFIPQLNLVDNIIMFKNELYASAYGLGIFKSPDGGVTWQNIGAGIVPFISKFCEWKNNLYATTLSNSVYELNPVSRSSWISFSNGVSSLSANTTTLAATSNTLVAGTLANGIYDYLGPATDIWEERFITGQISPSEAVDDIVPAHDSLFLAGSSGKFYLSTNDGFTWNRFANSLFSDYNIIVNAKQALIAARNIFDGQNFNTAFYYIKKDSLNEHFVPFSFLPGHLTYRIEIFDNKLWSAGTGGLSYLPLSVLPGISAADDSVTPTTLPLRFTFFEARLNPNNTVAVQWKTADEINIDHFEVERSVNGSTWIRLATMNPQLSAQYHYIDGSAQQGENYYRIKAVGTDGQFFYTIIKLVTIETKTSFTVWPNPVHDRVNINIVSNIPSTVVIRITDSKGALIKMQSSAISPGSNQFTVDMGSLANGLYSVSAEWNDGSKQVMRVLKQ